MKKSRILAVAMAGGLIALGPASAAVADVGPIDWSKSNNSDEAPPRVTKQSHPGTPHKSRTPNNPRVQITKTPKQNVPAKPQTPDKRAQKPAFKVDRPDAIGEAAFYGVGKPATATQVADGRVEAKGKPGVAPAEGRVEAKGKTPGSSVQTKQPPRQTVVRIPDKPDTPTIKPRGGQLPIGAPRTGFGSTAGTGADPVILATGSAILLGGAALAGVGVARRRRVLSFSR